MQCEICGNNIKGESAKIRIDFAEFIVCNHCMKYGTSVIENKKHQNKFENSNVKKVLNKNKNYFKELDKNIVENYNELIKTSRQKLNITQEELANNLKEKIHLIKKIERKELIPEEEVIIKLERFLKIKLLENQEQNENNHNLKLNKKKGMTIGDIVSIIKK